MSNNQNSEFRFRVTTFKNSSSDPIMYADKFFYRNTVEEVAECIYRLGQVDPDAVKIVVDPVFPPQG